MTSVSDAEIVSQFALRARRVATHSLAQDRDSLRELASFKISGHVTLEGAFTMRRELPNEEVFESLAARVRPFTLASEPIYFMTVFKALGRLLDTSEELVGGEMRERLGQLQAAWAAIDLQGTGQLAFWVQSASRDGSDQSPQVTDIQLAASWMYADLVHSDPKGPKREGLRFPIKERYSAAVSIFSRLTLLTLDTYDAIMQLHESGAVQLDSLALDAEVVIGTSELVEEGIAYVGPVDAPMPSVGAAIKGLSDGWQQFTPTELLRSDSRNQVEVVMAAAGGAVVATYDAAVSRRWHEGEDLHWEALIAGVVTVEIALTVHGEDVVGGRFVGLQSRATTNRMKLADAKLQREMSEAETITFMVGGTQFLSLGTPPMEPEESAFVDVSIDTLNDLVAIEDMRGEPLAPLTGSYSAVHRARLRQVRLLMEGHVIPLAPPPMRITAARGVVPQVVMDPGWSFVVGDDTAVPMPAMAVRHPLMRPDEVTAIVDSDPARDSISMGIPVREPFVAWDPDLVAVTGDEDLRQPTRLGLTHFNESDLFGGWNGSISTGPSAQTEATES